VSSDAIAKDGEDSEAGRKRIDARQIVDARVRVEEDCRVVFLQRGLDRESLVVIGGRGPAVASGRRETMKIIDRHGAGRLVANGANWQISEVVRLIGQDNPGRARWVGTEATCAFTIGGVNRERAKTDGHGIVNQGAR
jgi:hypothetical protein